MSEQQTRIISASELAAVTGATSAKTLPQAIGNYLTNNGDGSFVSKAAVLGEKLWDRAKYSLAITPTIDQYADQIRGLPGGQAYLDDVKRIRP